MAEKRRAHLHELDVIRILTFAAVIAVHAIAFTEQPSNRAAAGMLMLLQFGRELFFALMGFVLVYSAQHRYAGARAFWRRRFAYVAVPYVAWTFVYWLDGHWTGIHQSLVSDLVTGNAEYHLYFLLVTMQLYLAFPLILGFVRRTANRAGPVLAVVGVLNVAWLAALHSGAAPASGWATGLWGRAYELLPTYSIYVLAGCYGAMHVDRLRASLRRRPGVLLWSAAAAAALATVAYVAQLPGRAPRDAADVLQPAMVLTCVAAVLVLSVLAARWTDGPRRGAHLVTEASDISFGVYLAHPLVLQLLLHAGLGNGGQRVPAPIATVLAFVGAAAGAVAITLVARQTRLSLPVSGRPRRLASPVRSELPAVSEDRLPVLSAAQATMTP